MSMPQIPEEKNRPNLCEVTIDILKSVALEETALSHILNAEGERAQAILKKFECPCSKIGFEELNESVIQTKKILNTIIMKEWLLLQKIEAALEIGERIVCCDECDGCKHNNCKGNCCNSCCSGRINCSNKC